MPKNAMRSVGRRAIVVVCILVLALAVWIAAYPTPDRAPRTDTRQGPAAPADATSPAVAHAASSVAGESAALVSLVARDLWDSSPIASLALRASRAKGSGSREDLLLTFDEDGRATVPRDDLERFASFTSASREYVVASTADDVRDRNEVWCYRVGTVSGRVVFQGEQGVDFGDVELSYSPQYMAVESSWGGEPGSFGWMRRNRVTLGKLGGPREDGTFRLDLARVRGAAIVARAPGWFPAWAPLAGAFAAVPQELVLVLRRGIRLAGTLRDENGAPLAGQKVHVYVVVKTRRDDLDTEAVGRLKRGGFTAARSRKDDWARHKLHYSPRTDGEGKWGVDIDTDGEVFVVAYPENRAAVERRAGPASRIAGGVDLVARVTVKERIRIEQGGRPLARAELLWIDFSLGDAQPSFRLTSDGAGFVESTWFVPGKRYCIVAPRGGGVFFRYSGQRTIDLDTCERDFDRFMSSD